MLKDGINCINVYSKGKTVIGKLLSNFAHTPFKGTTLQFESVEGWWYWYITGKKYDHLASLYGFHAKKEGRKYPKIFNITPEMLKIIYELKIDCNLQLKQLLIKTHLPFTHFYEYHGKTVKTHWQWTGELWNDIREELKKELRQCLKQSKTVTHIMKENA